MPMAVPKELTVGQAAKRTGMWPQTIRRLCATARLEARLVHSPVGDYWLIPIAALDRYRPPGGKGQPGRPLKKGLLANAEQPAKPRRKRQK